MSLVSRRMPSSVLRTAPIPAVNALRTRSGTQASSFWRTDSGITESSAPGGGGMVSTSSGSGSVGVLGGCVSRSLGDMSDLGGVRAIMPVMVAPAKKEAEAVPVPVRTRSDTEELTTSSGASQLATARPPARIGRFFKAYWVTFIVIASYLSLRIQARFRSEDAIMRLLERKHRRNSRRIERAIVHLQGLYIKVGQLISIMTNFLPAEFRTQLEGLQDQVPPRPYEDIERRIREEFGGKSPDELFQSFDRRPIASASIGQVHLARLSSGQRVAVKVQYPDIETIVKSDLATLRRIFRIVQFFVP